MQKRARMKPGVRPIVVGGCQLVPEFPTYWDVPADDAAGVALLVEDGQVEYEPVFARGANGGDFAPALQTVQVAARPPARGKGR